MTTATCCPPRAGEWGLRFPPGPKASARAGDPAAWRPANGTFRDQPCSWLTRTLPPIWRQASVSRHAVRAAPERTLCKCAARRCSIACVGPPIMRAVLVGSVAASPAARSGLSGQSGASPVTLGNGRGRVSGSSPPLWDALGEEAGPASRLAPPVREPSLATWSWSRLSRVRLLPGLFPRPGLFSAFRPGV
jgi:hypothetical protein